jgi:hypothetical protein
MPYPLKKLAFGCTCLATLLSVLACSVTTRPTVVEAEAADGAESDAGTNSGFGGSDGGLREAAAIDPWTEPTNLPSPIGPAKPLTCAWLDSDNCWKSAVAALQRACVPGGVGEVDSANPLSVNYPSGLKALRRSGNEASYYAANYRYFNADGTPCGSIRTGPTQGASFSIEVGGRVLAAGNLSGTGVDVSTLVCADGASFSDNGAAGAERCPNFTNRSYAGKVPALYGFCKTGDKCQTVIGGAAAGALEFAPFKP